MPHREHGPVLERHQTIFERVLFIVRVIGVQTVADVFDLPVEIPHTPELSALGAAINAAVAAGIHANHGSAAKAMVRIDELVEPDPGNVVLYNRQYTDGFLPVMEALKPIYKSMDWQR